MFETSYFDRLQDYLASGCTMELTGDEMDYYNALYALIGIQRKYGKDNAISFLMHDPFQVKRARAREMYNEAINLFFANDSVENNAHRNMMFDNLQKAAQVVLMNAHSSKDMEVYGNLMIQAAKIKQLDKPDPQKRNEVNEKPIKIYTLDAQAAGMPQVNRQLLAEQIDSIPDIPEREKVRLKRDAQVIDVDIIEMLDDQETKTKDID